MPFVTKLKGGLAEGVACADCRLPGFDDVAGCADTDCSGDCIDCLRAASPCDCTCKSMGFASCATTTAVDDCSCTDATTEPSSIITGAWIGFSDAPAGHTLAEMARLSCDGDATTKWRLYGTTWNFTTHRTNESMACPTTAGLTPMTWGTGGVEVETDLAANPLATCTGGVAFFSVADLGIATIPTPDGTGTDCTQEGGVEMFVAEVRDNCGNTLVICPFAGVIGARFTCQKYDRCCRWNIDLGVLQTCDGATPGTALITVNATRTLSCECVPVTTVRIDVGGPTDHTYTLTGTSAMVTHTVTPCLPLANVQVDITNTYDACADCAELNGTETVFLQI